MHGMGLIVSCLRRWRAAGALGVIMLVGLLAGCGGAASMAPAANHSVSSSQGSANGGSASNANSSSTGSSTSQPPVAQYLIKSLSVSMTAPDPRKTAADLQSWILTTDPKAFSAGLTYSQDGSSYDVTMTFNVEAAIYPQIESYLASYAQGHDGALLNLQETVQDVTNDYVDSQSRLTNLRGEQQRLQTLMSQAQSLSDVLDIEQRLTDVEGQIEDTEAHLSQLSGQTSYYTVRIEVTPPDSVITAPVEPWNPLQTLQQAWGAAVVFGQFLLTLLIWLGVFAIYILPVVALIWGVRRLLARRRVARITPQAPVAP
jgi:hypothetical protein